MKWTVNKAVMPLILAVALLCLTACGSGGGSSPSTPAAAASASSEASAAMDYASPEGGWDGNLSAPQVEEAGSSVYQDPNAKLIRRADLYIQTSEFTQASQQLNAMVVDCGGYFESASVEGGSYRNVNAARYGYYVIRVPEETYNSFLNAAGDLGYVSSKTESTENISVQYYDTEARLKTLRTKQERLQALLAKAEVMEDIITLENALSDVEYEIEQYSSTMNRYDSLVSFATISLNLQEVVKVTEDPGETSPLGAKMAAGFSASAEGLVRDFQNLLVWISYHAFGLLIFGVVAAVGITAGVRTYRGKKKTLASQTDQTEQK